jgi:hypothetical protein
MVFNATFNNISVMSWRSVLLVEQTGVSGENLLPASLSVSCEFAVVQGFINCFTLVCVLVYFSTVFNLVFVKVLYLMHFSMKIYLFIDFSLSLY